MKATKFSLSKTQLIDLGTKVIHKYPTPTKDIDIGVMVVNGRHPEKENEFVLEHACQFVMYVIRGSGKVFCGEEVIEVTVGDVVFVPTETRFAVEGEFEYITVDSPAYFPEQSETVVRS